MKNTTPSRRCRQVPLTLLFLLLVAGTLSAFDQTPAGAKSAPAEMAVMFLKHLEKAEVGPALQLWDTASVNDKLKLRLDKMALKVQKAGGIKKIDVGQCEARRIKRFEQKLGGKLDVVPLEIICGNEILILAVFTFRETNDGYRILQLESLKEWGGTASLDDELHYSN
jgi:hypothetical protein